MRRNFPILASSVIRRQFVVLKKTQDLIFVLYIFAHSQRFNARRVNFRRINRCTEILAWAPRFGGKNVVHVLLAGT